MRSIAALVIVSALTLIGWYVLQEPAAEEALRDSAAAPQVSDENAEAQLQESPAVSTSPENTVLFTCTDAKSLTAVFKRDMVGVTLSDGRQFELREVRVDDGVRYENTYERTALVGSSNASEARVSFEEAGVRTYSNCGAAL